MENSKWREQYDSIARIKASEWHLKTGLDQDDLYQVACLTILEALLTYDASRGASEKTYLKASIHKALIDYVTKEFQHRNLEELSDELEDLNTMNPEQHAIATDLVEKLKLSEEEAELVAMRDAGYSDTEIGKHQNMSKQAVHKRRTKIKKRLKDDVLHD